LHQTTAQGGIVFREKESKQREKSFSPSCFIQIGVTDSRLDTPCTKQRRKGLLFFVKEKVSKEKRVFHLPALYK